MQRSVIRWPGLMVFVGIIVLLTAFSWLFLDNLLRWGMERTLGRLNGAEVNIAKVEHHWVPLGLKVSGVQITDPAQPLQNRLVVGELEANIEADQLLLGRVVIDQMTAAGIRIAQPRQSEGEVYAPVSEQASDLAGAGWEQLNATLPSVEEIVAKVGLQTDTVVSEAKQKLEAQKTAFNEAKQALPSKEKIQQYQEKIKAITSGKISGAEDLAKRKQALDDLKAEIKQDKQAVKTFKEEVGNSKDLLQQQLAAVKNAPGNDIDRIKQFFNLDGSGLGNITGLLFGDQAQQWSQYVLLAYEQVAPMMARSGNDDSVKPVRGEGQWISFVDEDAKPEFLIKKAKTEIQLGATTVDVDWQNITHQHQLLGQPTTYQARADNNGLWDSFNLNGEIALTDMGFDSRQQWQLRGAQLQQLALSQSDKLSAVISSARLNSDGDVNVRNSELGGSAGMRFSDMVMQADGSSQLTKTIAGALQKLERLDIRTKLSGNLTNPSLQLQSDLDQQLGQLMSGALSAQSEGKLADIKAKLSEQIAPVVGDYQGVLGTIGGSEETADNLDQQLEELLKAKVEDNLKDLLKGKLFGN